MFANDAVLALLSRSQFGVPVPQYQEHVMSGNCIQYLLQLIVEGFFCLVFRFIGWSVHLNYGCLYVFRVESGCYYPVTDR